MQIHHDDASTDTGGLLFLCSGSRLHSVAAGIDMADHIH
jgi:hypothetical protein